MDGIQEGIGLGNKAITLAAKTFGPWFTQRQADADARAAIQEVLTDQVATYMETHTNGPALMDAIASCGGKFGFDDLVRIVRWAIPQLSEEAKPDLITDDWGANFRDKARTCFDPDMAKLWAQLLAAEANSPGSYSRKTANVLADLEPKDAHLFKTLSGFRLVPSNLVPESISNGVPRFERVPGSPCLTVLDDKHPIYTDTGISFSSLARLEWLGLVRYVSIGWVRSHGNDKFAIYEHGDGYLYLASDKPINFGCAEFTPAGAELSGLCTPLESPDGLLDYLTEIWRGQGVRVAHSLSEAVGT